MNFKLTCEQGHSIPVDHYSIGEHIEDDRCPTCSRPIAAVEPRVPVCCPCGYYDSFDWSEAASVFENGCPNGNEDCDSPASRPFHQMAVRNSGAAEYHAYQWSAHQQDHRELTLADMEDHWEYLVHFTDAEGFVKIAQSGVVEVAAAGYYYQGSPPTKAVCLTEAPLQFAARFFCSYGEFGFVFRKADLQQLGALPIVHLSKAKIQEQERLGGFAPSIKPFVQLVRTESVGGPGVRYDWIHDREWRVPIDIPFTKVKPIGVVFKDSIDIETQPGVVWRAKRDAALEYNEVVLRIR